MTCPFSRRRSREWREVGGSCLQTDDCRQSGGGHISATAHFTGVDLTNCSMNRRFWPRAQLRMGIGVGRYGSAIGFGAGRMHGVDDGDAVNCFRRWSDRRVSIQRVQLSLTCLTDVTTSFAPAIDTGPAARTCRRAPSRRMPTSVLPRPLQA